MLRGLQVAGAVAAMLAITACGDDDDDSDTKSAGQDLVKCYGINECKGHTECATSAGNSCEGLNECAGLGWITVSAEECSTKNGTVVQG